MGLFAGLLALICCAGGAETGLWRMMCGFFENYLWLQFRGPEGRFGFTLLNLGLDKNGRICEFQEHAKAVIFV